MTKEEIILANKEFLFPAVFHFYQEPLVIARAKDQYVWDADGHQYLDFFGGIVTRSEEHTSELQSPCNLVCRLLLEKKQDRIRGSVGTLPPRPCGRRRAPSSRRASREQTAGPWVSRGASPPGLFFFFKQGAPKDSPLFPHHPPLQY